MCCGVCLMLLHQRHIIDKPAHLLIEQHHIDATLACCTSISHRQLQHWPQNALLDRQIVYVDATGCRSTGAAQQTATPCQSRLNRSSTTSCIAVLAQCIVPKCSAARCYEAAAAAATGGVHAHKALDHLAWTSLHVYLAAPPPPPPPGHRLERPHSGCVQDASAACAARRYRICYSRPSITSTTP